MYTLLHQIEDKSKQLASFETSQKHTWCSGCGNFAILNSLMQSLALEGYDPYKCTLFFDVGCSGNVSDKIETYTIHGLHGRVIPLAAGASLAKASHNNYSLTAPIIALAGDGATLSEGVNHLIHAVKSDYNLLFILHNNQNYGLTTGQASSTTLSGTKMNGSSEGKLEESINSLEMILSLNPSFIARGFSGDPQELVRLMRAGMNHSGFAVLEILQSCPTFNKATPSNWYLDKVKKVEEIPNYDPADWNQALKILRMDREESFGIGVVYQRQDNFDFYNRLKHRQTIETDITEEVDYFDIEGLLAQFI